MKIQKNVIIFCLMAAAVTLTTACDDIKNVAVSGVTIDGAQTELQLALYAKTSLTVTVTPMKAYNKSTIWRSSNPDVVEVVKINQTTAEIIAKALIDDAITITVETVDGGFTDTRSIKVFTIPVAGVSIDRAQTEIELPLGTRTTLKATVTPEDATYKTLKWTSSNPDAVEINETTGLMLAKAMTDDLIDITVETVDGGFTDTRSVKVTPPPVSGVTIAKAETGIELPRGKTTTLAYTVLPVNAANKKVTWSSDKPEFVTVDETTGLLTAVAVGTAVITVKTDDGGHTATCAVTVPANLLWNPSFEEPDDGGTTVVDWEIVPSEWFQTYYNWATVLNYRNDLAVRRNRNHSDMTGTGNGSFFSANISGDYCVFIANNQTRGIFQIVDVIPGGEYRIKVDFGFYSSAAAQTTPMRYIKILSVQGKDIPEIPKIPVLQATVNGDKIILTVTGIITIPAGVNQIRFQLDQVSDYYATSNARTPHTCIDACEFVQVK